MYKTKRQRKEARWGKSSVASSSREGAARRYFVGYPSPDSLLVLDASKGEPAYPFKYKGETASELDKRFDSLWGYGRAGYPLTQDKHLVKEIL